MKDFTNKYISFNIKLYKQILFRFFDEFIKNCLLILFVVTISLELVFSWVLIPYFNSIRNITLYPIVLITILALLNHQINISNFNKKSIIFLVVLFFALVANLITAPEFSVFFVEIKRFILSSAIFFCTFIILYDRRKIYIVMLCGSIFFSISCLVLIFQAFNLDLAWEIRGIFGFRGENLAQQFINRPKPFGLNSYSINFSHSASLIFPFVFQSYLRCKSEFNKYIFRLMVIIYFSAIILSSVNSMIIGTILYFIMYYYYHNKRIRKLIHIFFPLMVVLSITAVPFMRDIISMLPPQIQKSINVRIPLNYMNIIILYHYPLGVPEGLGYFNLIAGFYHYIESFKEAIAVYNAPHNYVLSYGLTRGGVISVLLAVLIYWLPLKMSMIFNRYAVYHKDYIIESLGWGIFIYAFNSLFHNGGPLFGHQLYFIICGMIYRLYINNNSSYYDNTAST